MTQRREGSDIQAVWLAHVALALAALFWSGNFVAGRALREAVDPVTLNTLRWGLALVLFLPFALPVCLRNADQIRRHWRLLLGLGATGVAGFQTIVYAALAQTTATNALLVLAFIPVTILIGSALMGDTRPGRLQWAGSGLSLVGVGVLITRADIEVIRNLSFNPGDLWILVAVVLWSVYSLLLRRRPPELSQQVTLAVSMVVGFVILLPVWVVTAPSARLELSLEVGAIIGYLVLFPSLLSFWLWSQGVARVGPEKAGQFIHLMPIFGSALAVVILGERIGMPQVLGALIVFAGIAAVVRGQARRAETA